MDETAIHVSGSGPTGNVNPGWTVGRLLQRMETRGDAPAVISVREGRSETWSCRRLSDTVRRLATGLCETGVVPGERVAVCGPNTPEWIAVALALNAVGALVVPIDDLAADEHVSIVLAHSGAKRVFSARDHLAGLRSLQDGEGLEFWLLDTRDAHESGARPWQSLLAGTPSPIRETPPDRAACLFYTSGTTGPPKAFVLTHANMGTNVQALARERLVGPGDRALLPLPLHHAYPYVVGMLTSLESGMAIVLPQSVTGPHIMQALKAAHVTVIIGVPRLYEALLDGLKARMASRGELARYLFSCLLDLCVWSGKRLGVPLGPWLLGPVRRRIGPDLRLLISGGARLEAELAWTLEALGWQALGGYGLAETASVFTGNLPRRKRLGSAGMPLADGEVRIAEPDEIGIGEIELRGSSVTREYLDNPEANRIAFTEDGWFRTGDLGYQDEDGFLYVTGRAKEVIVLGGGKKLNPEELEKSYAANTVIAEIAVLEHGGQLVALVRPDPERLHEIGALNVARALSVALAEVGQGLPAYQRLAGFAITRRALPRTHLGKYRRFLLPVLYEEAQRGKTEAPRAELSAGDRELLANPIAAEAWNLIVARYADKGATLDAHLGLDLGIDSLEWMALSLELEAKVGTALAGADMAEIETARDLLTALMRVSAGRQVIERTRTQRLLADREHWLLPTGLLLTLLGLALGATNKIVMRVVFRLRVEGLERVPRKGPLLLVPNHASDLDPLAVAAALPFSRLRRTYWAGDVVRVFGSAVRRLLCRAAHVYPVDDRMPASAIEMASWVVSQGNAQVWFPEGWRSPDGRLQRFLPGIGKILIRSRTAAIPVYISGTFEAMPRTRRWPRPHPIRVVIGAPLEPDFLDARGQGETSEERVASALRAEVAALAASIGGQV